MSANLSRQNLSTLEPGCTGWMDGRMDGWMDGWTPAGTVNDGDIQSQITVTLRFSVGGQCSGDSEAPDKPSGKPAPSQQTPGKEDPVGEPWILGNMSGLLQDREFMAA